MVIWGPREDPTCTPPNLSAHRHPEQPGREEWLTFFWCACEFARLVCTARAADSTGGKRDASHRQLAGPGQTPAMQTGRHPYGALEPAAAADPPWFQALRSAKSQATAAAAAVWCCCCCCCCLLAAGPRPPCARVRGGHGGPAGGSARCSSKNESTRAAGAA
jgi:hypothetical protein